MAEFSCRFCQSKFYADETNPDGGLWPGGHWAKRVCGSCGKLNAWLPKPENEKRRPASHRDLVRKYGEGFCELCMRTKEELRSGDTFEAHHIREYRDNGEPDEKNILIVCTSCHRFVNWLRTYHGGNGAQASECIND